MWTLKQLSQKIQEKALLTEGSFQLRSGKTSSFYFDKYRFESDPELLSCIVQHIRPFIPHSTDLLAGLELGGVPIATALSLETGIPTLFVRKEAKKYGTKTLAEGGDIQGKKVVIIEDVITTGGQVILSTGELRKLGAKIDTVICVIHRQPHNDNPQLEKAQLQLKTLFNLSDFDHPLLKS